MNKNTIKILTCITCFLFGKIDAQTNQQKTIKPNVIIIFTDDQGYQDLGCYQSPLISTPNLDKMASEGIRITDFYVSNSVCSPSRASLLTGRFPSRHGVGGALFPEKGGLDPKEITLAEMLKTVDYRTACFGKWHLGDKKSVLPINQGFDEYFGIPYSNDMYIGANQEFSDKVLFREGYNLEKAKADQDTVKITTGFKNFKKKKLSGKVPLFEGDKIIEYPCDQGTLTQRYFDKAIDFINRANNSPFFLFITPAMPHVPLYASEEFKGKSKRGLYGDVIEEIDFNVGRLMKYIKDKGLDKNTIVIYSSDNGPWLSYGEDGGSALPLRNGKASEFEGGIRVPCIMRWPEHWDQGATSNQIISAYDIVPTIAYYANAKLPNTRIDGQNLSQHLEQTTKPLNRDIYPVFRSTKLVGIRKGNWKYLPIGGTKGASDPPMLFNLKYDISESKNVYNQFPEIVKMMDKELKSILKNIEDD